VEYANGTKILSLIPAKFKKNFVWIRKGSLFIPFSFLSFPFLHLIPKIVIFIYSLHLAGDFAVTDDQADGQSSSQVRTSINHFLSAAEIKDLKKRSLWYLSSLQSTLPTLPNLLLYLFIRPSSPFLALPRPSSPFLALPRPSSPFLALPRPSSPFLAIPRPSLLVLHSTFSHSLSFPRPAAFTKEEKVELKKPVKAKKERVEGEEEEEEDDDEMFVNPNHQVYPDSDEEEEEDEDEEEEEKEGK
jgi:hypothetical protein